MKIFKLLLALVAGLALNSSAWAHKPSDSYLSLKLAPSQSTLQGQWDIDLRDLEHAIGLDLNGDAKITWGELKGQQQKVVAYAFSRLSLAAIKGNVRQDCPLKFDELLTDQHVDGGYAVLRFHAQCAAPLTNLSIRYSLLFDVDPNHRGLFELQAASGSQTAVFSKGQPENTFKPQSADRWNQFRQFVGEGIWHILHGYDHILFLITLLLPAVMVMNGRTWSAAPQLRDALWDVARVVSMFTLAHSVTLSLAALGILHLPSRFVESAIALTVLLGAMNNLIPIVTRRRWIVAFAFGLIHGFGFASVLRDLGLERGSLALTLFAFNVGVEIGQLAIVCMVVPIIYPLRQSIAYRRVIMPSAALIIGGIAVVWFTQRAFLT